MCCGAYYSLVLDADQPGMLHGFGSNAYGELCVGYGGGAPFNGSADGSWDAGGFDHRYRGTTCVAVPSRACASLRDVDMAAVAAGRSHTLILTLAGAVWACGRNAHAQLGHRFPVLRPGDATAYPPAPLSGLGPASGQRIIGIGCGMNHSLAVDVEGIVHAWGCNEGGQLGRLGYSSGNEPVLRPMPVPIPGGAGRVVRLSAGNAHSAALTDGGQVLVWGSGCPPCKTEPTLVALPGLAEAHACGECSSGQIVAGAWNTIVALGAPDTSLRECAVLAWGSCRAGQCGYPLPTTGLELAHVSGTLQQPTPLPVEFPGSAAGAGAGTSSSSMTG